MNSFGAMVKKLLLDLLLKLLKIVLSGVLLASCAGYLGTWHWYFELASHFKLQYLALSCACLAGLICWRAWPWALAALFGVVINGMVIAPYYFARPAVQAAAAGDQVRLLLSNVFTANRRHEALIALVRAEQPDVLIVQEVDDRWAQALASLDDLFPHRFVHVRRDDFGLAVLSRLPLEEARVVFPGSAAVPGIAANLNLAGQPVFLFTIHATPPASAEGAYYRNEQLQEIAALLRQSARPAIIAGDLNLSPWSPYYSRFVRETGLADVRQGFGLLPTWPTHLRPMMIPIDHCLVSPDIEVSRVRTGEHIGSDHLPLIVDLMIPKAAPQDAAR